MKFQTLHIASPFILESGESIPELKIGYSTVGELNHDRSNVVWVFHALTANSNPVEWWKGLVGTETYFDPNKYFIICANVLGGCYGTTGPNSEETPDLLKGINFPQITVKDIVQAHSLLAAHIGITQVKFAIGGSFGGYQALEFSLTAIAVENLVLIATSPIESAWNIAIHEAQRMAIYTDQSIEHSAGGKIGLEAARAIGLLTYRTPEAYIELQPRLDEQISDFNASSYIRYQGKKLSLRFTPHSYLTLINALDTHDISRGRGSLQQALSLISCKTLCVAIAEDQLALPSLMKECAQEIPNAQFEIINSKYGHDGFLLETEKITQLLINHFN